MRTQPRPVHVEPLESRRLFAVTFPQVELFNSDSDAYTPSDLNPFDDPPTGSPPTPGRGSPRALPGMRWATCSSRR